MTDMMVWSDTIAHCMTAREYDGQYSTSYP